MPDSPSNQQMEGNDAAIVEQIRAGDIDAFRVLVERHSQRVFQLAYRMTGNENDAEDVVQETFMRAFRQLDRFESRSAFGTWLYRIGANCALDSVRARSRRDEVSEIAGKTESDDGRVDIVETLPSSEPLPDTRVFGGEVRESVGAALNSLSAAERAAFVLRHFQEMPIAEIGQIMGLKENATKNTIFRAVRKLRQTLEPLMGELK